MQGLLPDRLLTPLGVLVVACALGGTSWGQQEGVRPGQQKIVDAVEGMARLEFIETPLEDVASFLRDRHKIEIQIDRKALSEAKISPGVPITAKMKDMSLGACLLITLRQVGLACVVQEGYLLITTPDRIQEWGGALPGLTTPKPPTKSGAGASGNRILDALKDDTRLNFIETPLEDVVDFLRYQHKIPIFLDLKALGEAGVRPVVPVTKNLKGISLRSALLLTLRELALTCARQDEFLVITTLREAEFWGGELAPVDSPSEKIKEALTDRTRLAFIETPLEDVVSYLQDEHDIPIVIDRRALDEAGIRVDAPITSRVSGVPLRSALRLVLDQLELAHVIENEVLVITTEKSRKARLSQSVNTDANVGTERTYRTWKDITGKHSTVAQFIKLTDGNVTLRKRDGTTFSIPLERLSTEDQQCVRQSR